MNAFKTLPNAQNENQIHQSFWKTSRPPQEAEERNDLQGRLRNKKSRQVCSSDLLGEMEEGIKRSDPMTVVQNHNVRQQSGRPGRRWLRAIRVCSQTRTAGGLVGCPHTQARPRSSMDYRRREMETRATTDIQNARRERKVKLKWHICMKRPS